MQITGDREAYKQQRFIPHSLEAGGPRSRCRQVPRLLRAAPWFTDSHLFVTTLAAGVGEGAPWGHSPEGTNPIHEGSAHMTSPSPNIGYLVSA